MLQVLLLAASPDVPRLRLDTEAREIQQVFQLGPKRDRFSLHSRTDVRWRDLRQAIVELRPAILQFSGHGMVGQLLLTDDVGGVSQEVPIAALKALLGGSGLGVRILFLNACNTAEHAESMLDVAEHVIAVKGWVSDPGASMFAQGFYSALVNGHGVKTAFEVGQAELIARSPMRSDAECMVHRFRSRASQDLGEDPAVISDPLVASLRLASTRANIFAQLPRQLSEQLSSAFPEIHQVIRIVSDADVLIQQASAQLPESFRGYRLSVAQVPLQAGAHLAWHSAVRDSAALSPYALLAILLVAKSQRATMSAVNESIAMICGN